MRKFYLNSMNNELPDNGGQMQDAFRTAYLIAGYLKNTLTDRERDELDEWVTASEENMRLFAEMTDEKNIAKGLKERGLYDADKAVELLKTKISAQQKKRSAPRLRFSPFAIAACLVVLVGLFLVIALLEKKGPKATPVTTAKNDLPPGNDKAILTISDGKQIVLDGKRGSILQKGDLSVVSEGGILSYQGKTTKVENHTLTVPNGGQYQLELADGSKAWLNSGSSITYPTAFLGDQRRVQVTGEVYFQVSHNASKPFIVHVPSEGGKPARGMEIEVLGTEFNVNAYPDEEAIKTTLLKGSVKVRASGRSVTIKPGQQTVFNRRDQLSVAQNVNTEEITAWRKGEFEFEDEPIENIMRQVARWYDVTVKYEGKTSVHFNASIKRNVPVSKLLHYLELTNRVHFTITGKTIIVKP